MEIVSGRTGKAHVTSQQFRQILEGVIGSDSCILASGENLEPELVSNNSLKIRSGMMYHHGNVSSVKIGTYDEVELENGTQGMKRVDLVVNRYTRNSGDNTEKNEWVVIMGTPAESNPAVPEYIKGNLQNGDLIDDCPLLKITLDGINVTQVEKMLTVAPTSKELGTRRITHKLLYYNADGTTGTFTLSDSVKNYDYIEIFYNSDVAGHKAPQKSIKLPTSQTVSSGDMLFDMTSFRMSSEDGTKMQLMNTILNVSGKTCKPETSRQINFGSTAGSAAWTVSNTPHHRVYRVVGYNYGS